MIVYSVMVSVDRDVETDWVVWMRDVHIPDVMATECFKSFSMYKVLDAPSGSVRTAYIIRYLCDSMEQYDAYRQKYAAGLQKDHTERYEGRFTAERILCELIAGGPGA